MTNRSGWLSLLAALALIFATAAGADNRVAPLGWGEADSVDTAALPAAEFPAIDPAALRQADAIDDKIGEALQFATPFEATQGIERDGQWQTLENGDRVWRLRFDIPGATDMNFGFERFWLPEGATAHIYDADRTFFQGAWTAANNKPHGEFWTPVVPGDSAVIEIFVPAGVDAQPEIELQQVAGGYRDFFAFDDGPHLRNHGSCNIDVECPEGDDWRDEIRSVGVYQRSGAWACTGQMVNDVPNSLTPYFLTADHCGVTSSNEQTLVVYWNYQAPECGMQDGGSLDHNQTGSTVLATRSDVDMTLVQLDDDPDEEWNVHFSGWDRSNDQPGGAVAIHHPRTHVKSISFAHSELGTTPSCIGGGTPDTHWDVPFWDEGTTEPGSSGSGIWNPQNNRLIGFLSGGLAACGNQEFDCYGKFAVAWDGSSASERLSDWLDPDGVNPDGIDGSDQDGFNIAPDATSFSQCSFNDIDIDVDINQQGDFAEPVTLSVAGLPSGVTHDFSVNPVTPPGDTVLSLTDLDEAGTGTFDFTIDGEAGDFDDSAAISVTLSDDDPGIPSILEPSDGAVGVSQNPTLEWSAADQAFEYEVQIATDEDFSDVVYSAVVDTTVHEVDDELDSSVEYFLRVRASNECGTADWSETSSFTTLAEPGDCPIGTDATSLLFEDFADGEIPTGWSTEGSSGSVTWVASTDQAHTGDYSVFAENIASVTDQRLATPSVTLPGDANNLFLNFQNWQHIESSSGSCWDGGILEISTDGGGSWEQVMDDDILVREYDGEIGTGFSNPLDGKPGWCGDPRDEWERYSVDLSGWAGEDVSFRFRFGTDSSVSRVGWYVDQVDVLACQIDDGGPPEEPVISVSPDNLDATLTTGQSTTASLNIANAGGGEDDLEWNIDESNGSCELPDWLSIDPTSGELGPGDDQDVDVSIDAGELGEGDYQADICIASNDADSPVTTVPVDLTVEGLPPQPVADVSPLAFDFSLESDSAASAVLSIGNTGGEDLEWSLDTAETGDGAPRGGDIVVFDDIDFSPNQNFTGGSVQWHTGDTCDCDTEPYNLNLYDTAGLAFFWPFNADGEAGVTEDGSTYAVLEPGDAVGPGADFFANTGTAPTANWRAGDGVDGYLGFRFENPDTATTNYGYAHITTGSSSGYPVTVHSWAYNQAGDPITVGEVGEPPACENPEDVPWLSASPDSGTTASGQASPVDVTVDSNGLDDGTYGALLCLTTNDPDQGLIEIPVSMTVMDDMIFFDRFEELTD